ncbi:PHP domain-containing protein [Kangiella sp.]|uniref:PHP domain-containing protein n=1 Tax=Kangiella sp. TaxID=1920245 RepID=UPI003A8E724D
MLRDLHNHTHASDGSLSPVELIELAIERGVDELAITDHDSVAGVLALREQADDFAINLIEGVEISAGWGKHTLHILGLNIDPEHAGLSSFLKLQQQKRHTRALEMAHKMQKAGIEEAVADVEVMLQEQNMVCRTHLAQYLLDKGAVNNFANAFKKYLAKGGKAFVKDEWFELEDAIAIIKQAGGVPVLAHPTRYKMGSNQLHELIQSFQTMGGEGIEVCYPNIHPGKKNLLANWAQKYNLLGSQGSDFHSPDKPWALLGKFPPMPVDVTPVWTAWQ